MPTTLRTLIDQSADYIKVDLADDEDSATIETRLISALNEAKNVIAMRFYPLYFTENVTLDVYSSFAVSATTKTFYRLVEVKNGNAIVSTEQHASTVYCDVPASTVVSVKYQYIPVDMAIETDAYPFPAIVDYRILCYRAAQAYYEIKGTSSSLQKASLWESKWRDALKNVLSTDDTGTVKDVYNFNPSAW